MLTDLPDDIAGDEINARWTARLGTGLYWGTLHLLPEHRGRIDLFPTVTIDYDDPVIQEVRQSDPESWSFVEGRFAARRVAAEEARLPLSGYGVVDSPSQLLEKFPGLVTDPGAYAVTFQLLRRHQQHAEGGWAWSMGGPYLGDQQPQAQRLYDEPEITEVFTYQAYVIGSTEPPLSMP